MRTWNIVALVLAIAFALSSISYAQDKEEKKTWGEKLSSAAETGGKALKQANAVRKGEKTGVQAVVDFTTEVSPTAAFWASHNGWQMGFGYYWGGTMFMLAFTLVFILIMGRLGSNRSLLFWIFGFLLVYLPLLRVLVFYTELQGSDTAGIMGFIALGTLLLEVGLCYKFFRNMYLAFSDDGFKGLAEVWWMDSDNQPMSSDVEEPERSICTNPACGKKMVLRGRCQECGHKPEVSDVSAQPPASIPAQTQTSPQPAIPTRPRLRTREERLAEAKKLMR